MFTNTLIYKQWLTDVLSSFDKIRAWFLDFNRRGHITQLLIAVVVFAVVAYLASLYFATNFDLEIRNGNKLLPGLLEEVRKDEFILQNLTTGFALENADVLQSMEKVSAIKYLAPETVVLSRPTVSP